MLLRIIREMAIRHIDSFMIQLKAVTRDLEKLMFIDLQRFQQILLTNVLLKVSHLLEITEAYLIIVPLEGF